MAVRRSALYLDFDNFFGGMLASDPAIAMVTVERPSVWLHRLCDAAEEGRRWIILRCYMNPAGWVQNPRRRDERIYFSRFRPFFTQAGFEVVDCPSLTRDAKNGADIRIAIDAVNAVRDNPHIDDFVVASSDADFTPLLHLLRSQDRHITLVATGTTAAAYESLADDYLDSEAIAELVSQDLDVVDSVTQDAAAPEPSVDDDNGPSWNEFTTAVKGAYSAAVEPINLSQLAVELRRFNVDNGAGSWLSAGSFARALTRMNLPNARIGQHHLWDTARHKPPLPSSSPAASPEATANPLSPHQLPASISRFAEITRLPRIPSENWPHVYSALETYAAMHEFNLTQSTKWSRDYASEQGHDIPRAAFSFAVRACQLDGRPLSADPPQDARQIGGSLLRSVVQRAQVAELEIDDDDIEALAAWLHVGADELHREE